MFRRGHKKRVTAKSKGHLIYVAFKSWGPTWEKLTEAILVKHTKFQSSSFARQDQHCFPLMRSQVYGTICLAMKSVMNEDICVILAGYLPPGSMPTGFLRKIQECNLRLEVYNRTHTTRRIWWSFFKTWIWFGSVIKIVKELVAIVLEYKESIQSVSFHILTFSR